MPVIELDDYRPAAKAREYIPTKPAMFPGASEWLKRVVLYPILALIFTLVYVCAKLS